MREGDSISLIDHSPSHGQAAQHHGFPFEIVFIANNLHRIAARSVCATGRLLIFHVNSTSLYIALCAVFIAGDPALNIRSSHAFPKSGIELNDHRRNGPRWLP